MLARLIREKGSQENAFTLLELMVVILIMGILATIAAPSIAQERKAQRDVESKQNVIFVADAVKLRLGNGTAGENLTLDTLTEDLRKNYLQRGTIIGMERGLTGYCLTAYHPAGLSGVMDPFVYDTALGDFTSEATTNCASTKAITPAYIVDEKRHLMPFSEEISTGESMCHTITPGTITGNKYEHVAPGVPAGNMFAHLPNGSIQLEGSLTLNETCTAIDYDLRVVNADPARTYHIPVSVLGLKVTGDPGNPVKHHYGAAHTIVINGTERVQTDVANANGTPVQTGLSATSDVTALMLAGSIHENAFVATDEYGALTNDQPLWTAPAPTVEPTDEEGL